MQTQEHLQETELGNLLRYWRRQRGKSQLELSLDTGISQRHLSFVESGRSVPSRDLLSIVSEKLDIPLRERNVLLLASGYAPVYEESSWEVPEMAAVTEAIDRMLLQQEPHPALVLDRYWNVIRTNKAASRFFGSFVDLEARQRPRNLLDLMFDPAGMRPFVENWEVVAAGLLQRISRIRWPYRGSKDGGTIAEARKVSRREDFKHDSTDSQSGTADHVRKRQRASCLFFTHHDGWYAAIHYRTRNADRVHVSTRVRKQIGIATLWTRLSRFQTETSPHAKTSI
jgi:transcriptional regulator with XRE-family HTH domain